MSSDLNNHPVIRGYNEWNKFGELLGMTFRILEAGKVEYYLNIGPEHLATPKAAHGGVQAALLDAALGVAALSAVCTEGKVVATVSLSVQYLRPALTGDELTVKANVLKKGRSLVFTEGHIFNQHGDCLATAQASMNAYPTTKLGLAE